MTGNRVLPCAFLLSGLRVIEWVDSYLLEHTGEDFEPKIFLIPQTIGPSLDDPDFVVEPFNEPERDFVFWPAVSCNAIPVSLNQLGELFIGPQPLPSQRLFPVVKEPPSPPLRPIALKLAEGLFQEVCGLQPFIGAQKLLQCLLPIQRQVFSVR